MLEDIKNIYKNSLDLWYQIADDQMLGCGHPGHMGPAHDEILSEEYSILRGAIETLNDIANKLEKDNNHKKKI